MDHIAMQHLHLFLMTYYGVNFLVEFSAEEYKIRKIRVCKKLGESLTTKAEKDFNCDRKTNFSVSMIYLRPKLPIRTYLAYF